MRKWIIAISMMVMVTVVTSAGVLFAQDDSPAATPDAAPWLGVGVVESNNQVVVAQIQPNSPAATAKLAVGDIIVSFDGTAITSINALAGDVMAANSGDTVTLDLLRNGKTVTADVLLASAGANLTGGSLISGLDPLVVTGNLLSAQFSEVATGYQVTALNATANPFKLKVGDVVTTINGQNVKQLDLTVLQKDVANQALPVLTIMVMRNGVETTLQGQPPVGSLSFGRPGGQEDAREGNHRDDQSGGEGGGEGGEGSPTLVAPNLTNPTPALQPASTVAPDTFSQI